MQLGKEEDEVRQWGGMELEIWRGKKELQVKFFYFFFKSICHILIGLFFYIEAFVNILFRWMCEYKKSIEMRQQSLTMSVQNE